MKKETDCKSRICADSHKLQLLHFPHGSQLPRASVTLAMREKNSKASACLPVSIQQLCEAAQCWAFLLECFFLRQGAGMPPACRAVPLLPCKQLCQASSFLCRLWHRWKDSDFDTVCLPQRNVDMTQVPKAVQGPVSTLSLMRTSC